MMEKTLFSLLMNPSKLTRGSLRQTFVRAMGTVNESKPAVVPKFKTLEVTVPKPFVYHVALNRPDKLNAMNNDMWMEIGDCFDGLSSNEDCRVVLLSGNGKLFTAGLDFKGMMTIGQKLSEHEDVARRCKILREMIVRYQSSISSLERCVKPVIALIHSLCIGGGVDLVTAADIRYCTEDAVFQVKEVDIGMAADVGTLQRLPRVVGSTSLVNELAFTARNLPGPEAKDCGLANRIFKDKESMVAAALEIAEGIASKSPLAIQGTKRNIVYSRDHTVQEGLDHIEHARNTRLPTFLKVEEHNTANIDTHLCS